MSKALRPSHQSLGLIVHRAFDILWRKQHFSMRRTGRDHRKTIGQFRDPAIDDDGAIGFDHLLYAGFQIVGLSLYECRSSHNFRLSFTKSGKLSL